MTTRFYEDTQAEIHKVVVGPMDNNVYVLRCKDTGDAVLLDAANEHERLLDLCKTLGVRKVLETHGHWDHIQAVPAMRDAGYSVSVTQEDAVIAEKSIEQPRMEPESSEVIQWRPEGLEEGVFLITRERPWLDP